MLVDGCYAIGAIAKLGKGFPMGYLLNVNDVAIATAKENGTLKVERCYNQRLDMWYWAVSDNFGLIEVVNEQKARELAA